MEYLFGPYCSDKTFRHDKEMREIQAAMILQSDTQQTQTTNNSDPSQRMEPSPATPLQSNPNRFINRRPISEPKVIPLHGEPPQIAFVPTLNVTLSPQNNFGPSASSPILTPLQTLRRKAVEDQLGEDRTKRARLEISAPRRSTTAIHENSNSSLTWSDRMNCTRPIPAETAQESPDTSLELVDSIKPTAFASRNAGLNAPAKSQAFFNNFSNTGPQFMAGHPISLVNPQPVVVDNQNNSGQKEDEEEEEIEGEEIPEGPQGFRNAPSSGDSNASSDSHCTETPNTYESGSLFLGLEVEDYGTFNDKVDRVVRCKGCTHEVWGKYPDCCTNCSPPNESEELTDSDVEDLAFHEVQPSHTELDEGLHPRMTYEINPNFRDVYDEETLISLEDICEPYLDCGSSAYDSQDDDPKLAEEYETNSFIDDEEPEENSEENSSSDEDEIDYEEKFKKLEVSHRALQQNNAATENRHNALKLDFQDFRRDVLGSDYESEGLYDSEEMEEEGVFLVDVTPPDPVVTEVVLSDSESTPDSLMGELHEKSIKQEFSTADGESDEEGYTMVTPLNNHTIRELEL